jgi:hypothetical protein
MSKPDVKKINAQEELTASCCQALSLVLKGQNVTAITVALSFRVSEDEAVSHTATVAIHDTAARLHLETIARSLTLSEGDELRREAKGEPS